MLLNRETARCLLIPAWMFLALAGVALVAGLIFVVRDHALIGTVGVVVGLASTLWGWILSVLRVRLAAEESAVPCGR